MSNPIALPVVSVFCTTYNHAQYLGQAIDSVLLQETDFDVEMVIGEDCSNDMTLQIAQEYERLYPGKVRVLAHKHNIGFTANMMATMAACKGEYIAYLEGDDYWTDPTKLQRQVDALRAAPDCAMCFHDAELIYEDGSVDRDAVPGAWTDTFSEQFATILPPTEPDQAPVRFSQHDVVRLGWFMPAPSLLFRASSLPRPLPPWFEGVYSGDYTLHLLSTTHGSALYLPRRMAAYRKHAGGVSFTMRNTLAQNQRYIWENKHFRRAFGPELAPYFEHHLEHFYFERSLKLGAAGRRVGQLYYYGKAIALNPRRLWRHLARLARRIMGNKDLPMV